jgi:hypothetical protein
VNPVARCLCCAALFGLDLGQSQEERSLLLPSPVILAGVVSDSDGKPLSDVWINHTGRRTENLKTDAYGRFEITTRAPAVVFRKRGFQSRYWRVSEDRNLTIALTGATPRAKTCRALSGCSSLKGFDSEFCLPIVPGVNVSKQGNDIDYGQRWFWIRTQSGKAGIQHASGPLWGSGLPFDENVWSARDYVETSYRDSAGFDILDARGKSPDGKCWRVLGRVFETAYYRDVPEKDAALLDRVLDGACIQPAKVERR